MISTKESGDFSFTSLLCFGIAIVLRSSNLREASRTVVFAGVILLLSVILEKISPRSLSLPRILVFEGLTVCLAMGLFEMFVLIIPSAAVSGLSNIGEVLFALIFVPLLADRTERRLSIRFRRTLLVFLLFAVTIIIISVIRELGAVGTLWGIEITSDAVGKTPFLAQDSSAMLIVAAVTIAARLFVRRRGGDSLSFPGDWEGKAEVPYLDVQEEKKRFGNALAILFVTLFLGAMVFTIAYGLIFLGLPVILLPLFAVLFQAVIVGLLSFSGDKDSNRFSEYFRRPFLMPLQIAAVLIPMRFLPEKEPVMSQIWKDGVRYLAYIVLIWIFILVLISFMRTFRRKMIFGRRPKSVDGLPFIFIIMALGMIVMTAFASTIGYKI